MFYFVTAGYLKMVVMPKVAELWKMSLPLRGYAQRSSHQYKEDLET